MFEMPPSIYLQLWRKNVKVTIANKIYVQKGFAIEQPFSSALTKYFNSSAQKIDFLDESTVFKINKWVAQKTNGKINKIVSAGILNNI